jgi:hypothetical protein
MNFENNATYAEIMSFSPIEKDELLFEKARLNISGIIDFNKYSLTSAFSEFKCDLLHDRVLPFTFSTAYLTVLDLTRCGIQIFNYPIMNAMPTGREDYVEGMKETVKNILNPDTTFRHNLEPDLSMLITKSLRPYQDFYKILSIHFSNTIKCLVQDSISLYSYRHIRYTKRNIEVAELLIKTILRFTQPEK